MLMQPNAAPPPWLAKSVVLLHRGENSLYSGCSAGEDCCSFFVTAVVLCGRCSRTRPTRRSARTTCAWTCRGSTAPSSCSSATTCGGTSSGTTMPRYPGLKNPIIAEKELLSSSWSCPAFLKIQTILHFLSQKQDLFIFHLQVLFPLYLKDINSAFPLCLSISRIPVPCWVWCHRGTGSGFFWVLRAQSQEIGRLEENL